MSIMVLVDYGVSKLMRMMVLVVSVDDGVSS